MYHALYPRMVCMIVSSEDNIAAVDWVSPISFSPPLLMVSIGKTRFTNELIKQNKEFVVSVASAKMITSVVECGSVSGKKVKDKFEYSGLKRKKSKFIKIPSIDGAARNIECKLVDTFEAGDHTVFVGEILTVEKNDSYMLFHGENNFFPLKSINMPSEEDAWKLLEAMDVPESVVTHTKTVLKSLEILIKKSNVKIDVKLARLGAILHDIGRSKTHKIDHGFVGGQLLRLYGMPEKLVRIVELHTGAGIKRDQAVKNGMPARDFLPQTLEEKFVCYADKLTEKEIIHSDVSCEVEKWKKEKVPEDAIQLLTNLEKEMKNYFKS